MKLSGLHICQLWWEHRCQPTLSHTLFHTSDGWQIFTTGFLLHLTHRSHSETKTDPRWDGKRKQREREKKTCALCLCVCSAEDTLKEERRAPRLYFSKLSFSLSLCLPLVCCKAPISPSHPSVTQHPADQTPSSHSSPPSPLSPPSLWQTVEGGRTQTAP